MADAQALMDGVPQRRPRLVTWQVRIQKAFPPSSRKGRSGFAAAPSARWFWLVFWEVGFLVLFSCKTRRRHRESHHIGFKVGLGIWEFCAISRRLISKIRFPHRISVADAMYLCVCVYVCGHDICIYMHVCMYLHIYAFIHVCMCMCMHVCA